MRDETLDAVGSHHGANWRFARHFIEMLVAMIAGMAALGAVASALLAASGSTLSDQPPPFRAMLMATNMAIGMGAWMRVRGHRWPRIAEMSAAMYVPFLALMLPYEFQRIGGGALLAGGHVLMLPAMLAVMLYRRDEYSGHHAKH